MVNLELYRVFYTVAKCGSLTRAAEQLYISQPAVSQAIKQLESQLGGQLFLRTSKGMELTEKEGRMMFGYVEQIMKLAFAAENEFNEIQKQAAGTLRISVSDTMCKYFLLDYLAEFHQKYPQIVLNVLNSTTQEAISQVKAGKSDLGFVNLPVEEHGLSVVLQTQELHHIFVGGRKYAEMAKKVHSLKSLEDFPLLMLETTSSSRQMLINYCHSLGIHLHPEIELGSIDLLKGFARANLGITCIPREYVTRNLADGSLVEIPTDPAIPSSATGLITSDKAPLSFAVRHFIDCFKKET